MKHYSSIEDIQAYFENPAIDQSKLKRLILGLDSFLDERESKLYFEEKESFVIGSIVDSIITNTKEDFKKQYYMSTLIDKPSDTLKSIVNYVYDRSRELFEGDEAAWLKLPLSYHKSIILESVAVHNYQPRYGEQTKIDKVVECSAYFKDLQQSLGKKVVSIEEFGVAQAISESLKSLEIIKKCVEDIEFSENFDVYFQKAIYFKYKGVDCKALLDILIVDKKTGKYWIIDVKTMFGRTLDFFNSMMKYRYDIQVGFYREAVCVEFGVQPESVTCSFAVESTVRQGNPILYTCSSKLLLQAKEGRKPIALNGIIVKQELKGYDDLMETFKYHESTGFYCDSVISIFKNVGSLTLGLNGIVEEG